MNLLNKLTIKNLKLNKKRTIVTIIGVILSVALITAVATLFFSANASLIKYEISKKGNFHYVFRNVEEKNIKYFKENRDVENYYVTQEVGYASLEDCQNENKPYAFIEAFDKKSFDNLGINLVEGRIPESNKEIVIPTHLKTNGRISYKVGDKITLKVGKRTSDGYELGQNNPYSEENEEKLEETKEITYEIVGIIERPNTTIEPYTAPGYTFITYLDDYDKNKDLDIYVRYYKKILKEDFKVTADILDVDETLLKNYITGENPLTDDESMEISKQLDNSICSNFDINSYLVELEKGSFQESTMRSLGVVVLIVVSIIIFTSVFCIKNSFSISITEKIKQYGMLASVGATSKQIKHNVYYEAFILGLIGIPLGILLGVIASYLLIIISNIFLVGFMSVGFKLVFAFNIYPVFIAILIGFITLYLSAWGSAHKASKVSPIESITNSGDIKINAKKIKSPKYIKKIFGIGGDISYKNLKRNKKKYRTTVISIIVCVAVFIALASFIKLAFSSVKNMYGENEYNVSVTYDLKDKDVSKAMHNVTSFDGINNYAIVSYGYLSIKNKDAKFTDEYKSLFADDYFDSDTYESVDENGNKITLDNETTILVYRVGDKSYKDYLKKLNINYDDAKDKGILINNSITWVNDPNGDGVIKKSINIFKNKKDDKLMLYSNDKKYELTLVSVTTERPFGLQYYFSSTPIIVVSDEYFNKTLSDGNITDTEMIYLDAENADNIQDEIEQYIGKNYEYNLYNLNEEVKQMNSFFTLVAIFLYGFIIVIALIGITNIFNTITTSMELRSKEFAILRSVGMTKKEFNRMIRLESLFYGVKSLIIGIPIGLGLSLLIYKGLNDSSGITYSLPIEAILISICAVFILIFLIMKFTINKINKQNVIETIRNENI